jgi:hypothetical protein
MAFEEDPSVFFDDFARRVTTSGVDVLRGGILDQPQRIITEDGEVVVTDYTLLVRTNEFGGVKLGEIIVVDGVVYRVRHEPMKHIDGVFSTLRLMRSSGILPDWAAGIVAIDDGTTVDGDDQIHPGGYLEWASEVL